MIISFDYSVDSLALKDRDTLADHISELTRAHRLGHHIVVMKRVVAKWLRDNLVLASNVKSTLTDIEQSFTQTADLIRRSTNVLRVIDTEMAGFTRTGKFIEASLWQVTVPHLLDRTVIVIEDSETDRQIYEIFFSHTISKIGLTLVAWEAAHGGGSRSTDVAIQKLEDRRVVGVILDSDLNAPSAHSPAKIRRIEAIAEEKQWPLLVPFSAKCRELENMIPYRIVKELPCAQANQSIEDIENIIDQELNSKCAVSDRFWLYFDIKDGFAENKRRSMSNPRDLEWIDRKLSGNNGGEQVDRVQGFGKNVAEQLISSPGLIGELRKAIRGQEWWSHFGDYISDIMWLCAAPSKKYV